MMCCLTSVRLQFSLDQWLNDCPVLHSLTKAAMSCHCYNNDPDVGVEMIVSAFSTAVKLFTEN